MDGWFPRLNFNGDVASGSSGIEFNGERITDFGHAPQFLSENEIVFLGQDDRLYQVTVGEQPVNLGGARMSFFSAGHGVIARPEPGDIGLSVDPATGDVARLIEFNGNNHDHSIRYQDRWVIEHAVVSDVRAYDNLLVFSRWTGKPHDRETWGSDNGGPIQNLRVLHSSYEGRPIPFRTSEGPWVLFMTNTDLRLHPWNSNMGYIIHTGEDQNFNADVRFIRGKIHVVWNTARGELRQQFIDPTTTRQSVSTDVPLPEPSPKPDPKPDPKPKPKPEEPKPMPDSLKPDLENERAKYPATLTHDQPAKILNAVAWKNRADGWGLSAKPHGNRVPAPQGIDVAYDILHHKPSNKLFDCLTGDLQGVVVWGETSYHNDPTGRPWVAPVEPDGIVEEPKEEPKDPGDTRNLGQILLELTRRVEEMDAEITKTFEKQSEFMDALNKKLDWYIEDGKKPFRLKGSTNRVGWHAHDFDIEVTKS